MSCTIQLCLDRPQCQALERSAGQSTLAELTWTNTSEAGGFPFVSVLCDCFIVS